MIERRHAANGTESRATYSACEAYRYLLERRWSGDPPLTFVMLNPSTATELANDPTIERCERRARALGHGGLRIVNLFAFRATDPRALKAAPAPVGPDNDATIREAVQGATTLCAWGVHGAHMGRDAAVTALLREAGAALHTLGLTRHGLPRHPLYVSYATRPRPWRVTGDA